MYHGGHYALHDIKIYTVGLNETLCRTSAHTLYGQNVVCATIRGCTTAKCP